MIHRNQQRISTCEPSTSIKPNNCFKGNKKATKRLLLAGFFDELIVIRLRTFEFVLRISCLIGLVNRYHSERLDHHS